MNVPFSAEVATVLVILHKRFLHLCFCLSTTDWFEVGEAQLKEGVITYFHVPIMIYQHFSQNVMTCCQFKIFHCL